MTSTSPPSEEPDGAGAVIAALAEFRRWAETRFDRLDERLKRIEGELAELRGRWAD